MAQNTFTTLDIYLSSYLTLYDLKPVLEIRSGKVVFTFEASNTLYRLMNNFNSNEPVAVADFTTAVKTLRGKMLTLKGTENDNERNHGYSSK